MIETQLQNLADLFSPSKKTESTFNGYKIVVEEVGGTYDYEVSEEVFWKDNWIVIHSDTDFETEEEARKAAESYIDNWEPSDSYYAQ